jgi:tRNA (cytidine/uridine-2'-O-)-methyltransferase
MRLALYQPDIPQNAGTILRMAACFGVACEIIGPAGFDLSDRALRRAGLDYLDKVTLIRHLSFEAFEISRRASGHRLIVLTTSAAKAHTAFHYGASDVLLLGRESAGVPQDVHEAADARLRIPMRPGLRSLNVAVAAAIVLGEALRQTGGFELLQEDTAGSTS